MATLTAKELAQDLGTDGRTVRKFLRSITPVEDRPGKGSRWTIERKEVRSLRTKFSKWNEDRVKAEAEDPEEIEDDLTED